MQVFEKEGNSWIRTNEDNISPSFKDGALNHSAILPGGLWGVREWIKSPSPKEKGEEETNSYQLIKLNRKKKRNNF